MLTAVICTVTGWFGGAIYVWVIWEDRVGTYQPADSGEPSGWVHDGELYVRHQPTPHEDPDGWFEMGTMG